MNSRDYPVISEEIMVIFRETAQQVLKINLRLRAGEVL
jgi:hypothetical protein